MGLLDRVKASQGAAGVAMPVAPVGPAPVPSTNGPSAQPYVPSAQPVPAFAPTAPQPQPVATAAAPPPPRPAVGGGELSPAAAAAKTHIHNSLLEKYADKLDITNRAGVQEKIVELLEDYFKMNPVTMTKMEKDNLLASIISDVLGFGPLDPLIDDPAVSEIMANHAKQIYIEKGGVPTLSSVVFDSDKQMRQVIDKIVSKVGRRVDESQPICDARLPDGSRVNVVIPPIALKGPCLTIRKFSKNKLGPDALIKFGSLSPDMLTFLKAAVNGKLNILVSGGTGSGKTTLLNLLSTFVPEEDRIITCEDAAELSIVQPHWVQLESKPPNVEGRGAIPIRELVKSCLRMRPDRIIVGECRGGEALDMLQAMNTGHDGSMSTIHANNPKECLVRLETLVLQAGVDLPSKAIRETISSAVHLIVQQSRLRGGSRKIVSIAEILDVDLATGQIQFQELFKFVQKGINPQTGKAVGYHTACGIIPRRMEHLREEGQDVPEHIFQPISEPPQDTWY